jgi:ATP-dependent 26S proteasome regulatory subunit
MKSFFDILQNSYIDSVKMTIFNTFKTGDAALDSFITALIIALIGYIVNYFQRDNVDVPILKFITRLGSYCLYKKNVIILEGKNCSGTSCLFGGYYSSSAYSDRFKAIWDYIENNIETNKTIYQIKEYHNNSTNDDKNNYIYMVSQHERFLIDKNIFVITEFEKEDNNDKNDRVKTSIDKIIIKLYSYTYSISEIKMFIDNITTKYLHAIKTTRLNKKFIYTLTDCKHDEDDSSSIYNCWQESVFESARTFDNIFFDGKAEIIKRIYSFVNNKNWYYEKGIPYTLGIGLHGPPGTGKTSFIKALAKSLDRHVVVVPLKLIKTKKQLDKFFFEHTYNRANEQNSITFDKKIIVFEDIDCIGDIVLDRSKKCLDNKYLQGKTEKDDVKIGDVLQSIVDMNDNSSCVKLPTTTVAPYKDEPITLDDILNLWDGIRETPGRIIVISSNHYDKLDSALIRPGRIDISHELSNCSHDTITQLYSHLYGNEINKTMLKKTKPYFYSPAEIVNLYTSNKDDEQTFLKRLIQNKKVINSCT